MSINPNINVLIVDDYKTMLRIVRNLLGQIGIKKIDEATDGKMALDILKLRKYDLVISDWNMEPMSGYDLLKTLRTSGGENQNIPFIMVTAESKTENIIAAKQAGVNNYIIKPFSADTLKAKIETVMGAKSNA